MHDTTALYGVKHRKTGQFFAGFKADNSVLWSPREADAVRMDESAARGQALLLKVHDVEAQVKPAMLAQGVVS